MYKKCLSGFTIIELVVVLGMIGIVAGIASGTINIKRQQAIARDSTNKANLEKVEAALLSYYEMENYTLPKAGNHNPLDSSNDTSQVASKYIKSWPQDFVYNVSGINFSVHTKKQVSNDYFKVSSAWDGLKECKRNIDINIPTSCDDITPSVCGDAKCDGSETCEACPLDCGSCGIICGNEDCEAGETCESCSNDCGTCPVD